LLLGERQLTEWSTTRNVNSEPAQDLIRLSIDPFAIDQFQETGGGWFATQEDVGADIEIIEDTEFLMDKLDAERAGFTWRAYLNRRAVDLDRAAITISPSPTFRLT
jgi:hypothetical protein